MFLLKTGERDSSMNIDENNIDSYIQLLTEDLSLIDSLSDDVVEFLIKYLEVEITKKEKMLEELKKNNDL